MTETNNASDSYEGNEIAIIGLAGRFPGAGNVHEFWSNLLEGVESISFFDKSEVEVTGITQAAIDDPHFVRAGGVLDGVDEFDADFFGFYPKEAAITDPQQRVFLECAWEALESAGYSPENYKGWIGVFAGAGMNTYLLYNLISNSEIMDTVQGYQLTISNDKDFLSTRVSYKMNLRGPGVTVQTACSTSLVATHLACQSLLSYQCDLALAGGVQIRLPQKQGYLYQEGGILSPDGHCRAFDSDAQGTVGGNGVGVVVLKRLGEAIEDGDFIYAVIKGSAINNDGSAKVGYTAPSVEGQAEVIAMAQAVANVDPSTIGYIEAHGTGTSLGDPIEITALTQVFRNSTDQKGFCAIGSVKPNVGHLDAAAGITSLIKTTLALHHKIIPPSINFSKPNPKIDFDNSPFYINLEKKPWISNSGKLRAGVSSFGIGGTNAHIILEEAPQIKRNGGSRPYQLLMLSARSEAALDKFSQRMVDYLSENSSVPLSDIAYTLQTGKKAFKHRKFTIAQGHLEAINSLSLQDQKNVFISEFENGKPQIVFMYPGQGSQYIYMAKDLYLNEPVFRNNFDHCADIIQAKISKDIRTIVYPGNQSVNLTQLTNELQQTELTQPVLFTIEYSLSQLLISWGIKPAACIGHSIGEYVAATFSEVFSLEDAISVVIERGRLMQSVPKGSMLSVSLSEDELSQYLLDEIALAAVNGPNLCVVSGPDEKIEGLIEVFNKEGIIYRRLLTSHAFHSAMMDSIVEEFTRYLARFDLHPPKLKFISNLTGTWITDEQAMSPRYWSSHLRHTVRFFQGIDELMKDPSTIFLEVGPGRTLSIFVKSHPIANSGRQILSTVHHPQDNYHDEYFLLTTLGKLWLSGVEINWKGFYSQEKRHKVPLPTYPFERQKYWVTPNTTSFNLASPENRLTKRKDLDDWFYMPTWKKQPLPPSIAAREKSNLFLKWLVFLDLGDKNELAEGFIRYLKKNSQDVILVNQGDRFNAINPSTLTVNPGEPKTFQDLFNHLKDRNWLPDQIVNFWLYDQAIGASDDLLHNARKYQTIGFMSLVNLAKSFSKSLDSAKTSVTMIASNLFNIFEREKVIPAKATVIGACQVISQEFPNINCRLIDLYLETDITTIEEFLFEECLAVENERIVSYRNRSRWVQDFQPVKPANNKQLHLVKKGGNYLITGGLGRIGLSYVRHLVENYHANIIIVDKVKLPEETKWSSWLANHPEDDPNSLRIQAIKSIKALGTSVEIYESDLSDIGKIHWIIDQAIEKGQSINGIFHLAGFVGPSSIIPIENLDEEAYQIHLQSKMYGLFNLALAIENHLEIKESLDFILLQSSLSTVLGGLGLAAYSAANHFMDSFADVMNRASKFPWITINWDGWNFNDSESSSKLFSKSSIVELSMSPGEGLTQLEKVLANPRTTHWIISTADLETRINQWIRTSQKPASIEKSDTSTIISTRPKIQTPYIAPRDELEEQISKIWSQILGIGQLGINDDFFELGGHSLLATQLVTRIRDTYHVELPLRTLFESPTIAGLAHLIKENLDIKEPEEEPIVPISREGHLPLSFGQQRLWFLDQLDPGSPLYNNFTAFKLDGEFNSEAFIRSIHTIISRHESLRTVFKDHNGQPHQVILPEIIIPVSIVEADPINLNEMALEEARMPFDLTKGPLFRIKIIKIQPKSHVIFMTAHHIVSDGWSVNVMVNELIQFYSTYVNGEEPFIPPLEIQYADYASWQRKWMSGERLKEQINFWKSYLSGIPSSLDLPYDHPRPSLQTSKGASIWFELPEELTEQLRLLSHQEGLTLFMVMVGGLNILLNKYSGEEDIVIGTPVANRVRRKTEGLIGFLLNVLVIRSQVNDQANIRELLHLVKDNALQAYAHQDLPFELLVEALQPQRDLSRTPLFQVIIDFQDAQEQELRLPNLTFSRLQIDTGTSKYDLAISLEDHGKTIKGYFNYNTDLFEPVTIERMISCFTRILEQVAFEPEKPILDVELLGLAEKQKILFEWNSSKLEIGPYEHFIKRFEDTVNHYPHKVAISHDNISLSYSELDQQANQIAQWLNELGITPGVVVGLMAERSIHAIIAMMGIWKFGGVYLPLDPGLPAERLSFIIEDADARVILTQQRLLENLRMNSPELIENKHVLLLDNLKAVGQDTQPFQNNLFMSHAADAIAYVIYTSGSTGKPKGVMISNQAISDHLKVIRTVFEIVPEDRVLQFSAYSFDQSIEQILVTLISGAHLVLRGPELWEPAQFSRVINELDLTVVNIQPAYWQQWSQASSRMFNHYDNSQLRLVIIGGDVVLPEHVRLWWQTSMGRVKLLNAYGPTETTITASTYEIKWNPEEKIEYHRVPIGRPLPNRLFYVLDRYMKPVPIGVPGELYIGGRCLSSGYLNQQKLTAEKFIENPFLGSYDGFSGKIYKSGDLVRYLPSGDLEFLGRVDLQVKIRGFRIELGEIETILSSHPQVEMAAVIIRSDPMVRAKFDSRDGPTDKKLVAYLQLHQKVSNEGQVILDIRNYLKNHLPAYMIPSNFIILETLPYLASGKVDRKTLGLLPEPENLRPELASSYVAPRTQVEKEIASVWSEVLGVSQIGIYDNFFELGGHSLLATQIISRLREIYNVEIPLRRLFESPTIETFATAIAQSLVEQEFVQSGKESIEELLNELEGLSDDEIKRLLESEDND